MVPVRSTGFAHAAKYHCKKKREEAGGIKNIGVICIRGGSYRLFVTFHFWFCLVPFQTLAERCPTYLYRNEGINCIILNFKKTSIWRLLEGGGGGVNGSKMCVNISLL